MSPFDHDTTTEELTKAFADRIRGRTFVITGTTHGGLGGNAAVMLARESPAHIILVSRNKAKVEPVMREIAETNPSVKVTFAECELSDFDSVRAAARQINEDASVPRIDVLVNNAGLMMIRDYTLDKQGNEMGLSANHLGHFLLTNLLMGKIVAAAPGSRVVNVTSTGHRASAFRFDDYNFSGGATYHGWSSYGQSKTANLLFTVELARRLADRGVRAYAPHPGIIWGTGLALHLDDSDQITLFETAKRNTDEDFGGHEPQKTLSQGTSPLLAAALDPAFDDRSGSYVYDCQIATPRPYASDPELARKLWDLSEKLVGQKFDP
ncbi:retinol dehydrogenase 13 [Hypoxylon sp. FL1284]|nr:retinol dehydrogenase 13 [Hypoxylon sp. FL1284]